MSINIIVDNIISYDYSVASLDVSESCSLLLVSGVVLTMKNYRTSVVICGAGPAGLTLAHLLGAEDIDVMVLEKLEATVTEPRAIAIDGESLRTLQSVQLLAGFAPELLLGITADYVNGDGQLLFELGGLEEQTYGHPMVNSFDQPALDRYLADNLESHKSVDLRFEHTLSHFEEAERGVSAFGTNGDGEEFVIEADYLVACDGGRSTIREQLGIVMQGASNPQPWLVIDTIDPYMDDDIVCRFYCDPKRPGMTLKKRHQERRWEWMLMPGEEPEALLQDDTIRAIIAPYTNAERVNIYRKRVYNFHAIIADRWQTERVFLAGDAAHMTPPFAGQGLNSGFRDVRNLSWKLASVIKGQADAGVLQSYEAERRDHAHQLIETALELGRQIQPIDLQQAADRDAFFAEIQQSPEGVANLRKDMLQSVRARAIDRGLVVDPGEDPLNGQLLIQPRLNSVSARDFLMDEALGSGFAIVGFNCDPRAVIDQDAAAYWMDQGARLVAVNARGVMAHDHWLEDAYGELGRWVGDREHCLLLIRPDRFCMVAFTSDNAVEKLARARQLLSAAPGDTEAGS